MDLFPSKIEGPVAVIGDVHGQVDKLQDILGQLRALPDHDDRWIMFIGDLVDRGPNPAGATQMVLDLLDTHSRVACLCGNHELAMCGALHLFPPPEYAEWDQRWVNHYDSHTTFASYGAEFGDMPGLLSAMPDQHKAFYMNLPWCIEHPDYLFVHAGLEAHQPYAMQVGILHARDYTLTRPPWLCSKALVTSPVPADSPVTIVSGHVKVPEVAIGDRRLLIDTTGGLDGELSCVLLPENVVISSGSTVPSGIRRSEPPAPEQAPAGWGSDEAKPWWKVW